MNNQELYNSILPNNVIAVGAKLVETASACAFFLVCSTGNACAANFPPVIPPISVVQSCNMSGLSDSTVVYNVNNLPERCVDMGDRNMNLKILDSLSELNDNWDGMGASALSSELIQQMRGLVLNLHYQPEISPTPRNSIQFEYENDNSDYLEFELFSTGELKSFEMNETGDARAIDVSMDNPQKINEVVDAFYDRGFRGFEG